MEMSSSAWLFSVALAAGLLWAFFYVFLEARRRQAPLRLTLAASLDVLCGLGNALLGGAHLLGVIAAAVARGQAFEYDFRFYSLILLGTLIFVPGLLCLYSARGLVRAARAAWRRVLGLSLSLLVLNLALIPLQGFAHILAGLALANLLGLLAVWRYFRPTT